MKVGVLNEASANGNDLCSMHKGLAHFFDKRMSGGTERMGLCVLQKLVIE